MTKFRVTDTAGQVKEIEADSYDSNDWWIKFYKQTTTGPDYLCRLADTKSIERV